MLQYSIELHYDNTYNDFNYNDFSYNDSNQHWWHYLYNITYSLSVKSYDKCDIACMFLLCMYVFYLSRESQEMATFWATFA